MIIKSIRTEAQKIAFYIELAVGNTTEIPDDLKELCDVYNICI